MASHHITFNIGTCDVCGSDTTNGICELCGSATVCPQCNCVLQPDGNWLRVHSVFVEHCSPLYVTCPLCTFINSFKERISLFFGFFHA